MTNKEWLATISDEEWYAKIWWLFHIYGKRYDNTYAAVIEWLKETHND